MTSKHSPRTVFIITLLLLGAIPLGLSLGLLPSIPSARAQAVSLYVDCDAGTGQQADTIPDTVCNYDGISNRLVAEGGGITVWIRVSNAPNLNGFDITVDYNPAVLDAVAFDQSGSPFLNSFTLAREIDIIPGRARLAQVLLGGAATGEVLLYKLRFDMVGVGGSPLTLSGTLTNPGIVQYNNLSGSFDNAGFFSPYEALSFTISPRNPAPGSSFTLTGSVTCSTCTPPFAFSWDINSDGTEDANGPVATIDAPYPAPPSIVTLTVSDSAATLASAAAMREIPLSVAMTGPASGTTGTPTNAWTAAWVGGRPSYTANWRFCPGSLTLPGITPEGSRICTQPNPRGTSLTVQTHSPTSPNYRFAGDYENSVTITDSGLIPAQMGVGVSRRISITGTPEAYDVSVAAHPANPTVGQTVTVTATLAYQGDMAVVYDGHNIGIYDAAEPVLAGIPPSDQAVLSDDVKVKYRDADGDTVWDLGEFVFYDANGNGSFESGIDSVIAGTAPGSGTVSDDPLMKYRDANGDLIWNPGPTPPLESVVIDTDNDNVYDTADAVIAGLAPSAGTALLDDANVKYRDGTSPPGAWNTGELVFYDAANPSVFDAASDPIITGTCTSATVCGSGLVSDDARIKYVDSDGNVVFTVPFYPYAFRSATFDYEYSFGDGTTATDSAGMVSSKTKAYPIAGPRTVTVTASETGTTAISKVKETGQLTMTINEPGAFDYSLTVSPSGGEVTQGGTITADVTTTLLDGTTEAVTLSSSGQPPGVTVLFSQDSGNPTFTSTITITASPSAPTGPFTITITGTSTTGLVRTATFSLTINTPPPAFDYSLAVDPTGATVTRGSTTITTTATVTATLTSGTAQAVTLGVEVSGPSPGVTVSFDPNPIAPTNAGATSTMTLSVAPTATAGTYTITITSSPSGVTPVDETATFTLTVILPFDYSLSVSPNSREVLQGSETSTTVTATLINGPTESVTLSASGQPSGVTVMFDPSSESPTFTSAMTIATLVTTAPGTYPITITGTSTTGVIRTTSFSLTVNAQLSSDFTFSPAAPTAGSTVSFTATATGGTGPYSFTWDFGDETPTVTGNPVTHTYSSPGTYTVTVTATDTSGTQQTFTRSLTLGQRAPPLQLGYRLEYIIAIAAVAGAAAGLVFYFRKRRTGVESPSEQAG